MTSSPPPVSLLPRYDARAWYGERCPETLEFHERVAEFLRQRDAHFSEQAAANREKLSALARARGAENHTAAAAAEFGASPTEPKRDARAEGLGVPRAGRSSDWRPPRGTFTGPLKTKRARNRPRRDRAEVH